LRTAAAVSAAEWMQQFMNIHELAWDCSFTKEHVPIFGDRDIRLHDTGAATIIYQDKFFHVKAVPIAHTVPCVGYIITEEDKPGRLLEEKLRELNIPPGPIYRMIKEGKLKILPTGQPTDQFVGPPVKGRKIVLLGDTCNPRSVLTDGANCDVLVHEATFGGDDIKHAIQYGHSTAKMAGRFAKQIASKHLILTHFSPSLDSTEEIVAEASTEYSGPITAATDFLNFQVPLLKS